MVAPLLPAVEVNPAAPAVASVICLHGLGADGHDLESIVTELHLPESHGIRFIFPHAPRRAVTINNGYVMPAWYDIFEPSLMARREDDAGVRASERALCAWIEHEIERGIDAQRIVLAGFSQGGAIALHTGLRYARRLGGIAALSAYLPLATALVEEATPANAGLPVFMAHGLQDGIVPLSHATASLELLRKLNYPVTWHTYPMAHTLSLPELRDMADWLTSVLA